MGLARSLGASVAAWPLAVRIWAAVGAITVCVVLAIAGIEPTYVFVVPDALSYMKIAEGETAQVMQPFASRQLGALVVAVIAHGLHVTISQGFLLQAVVCLAWMLAVVFGLMAQTAVPRWMLMAVAVTPFWVGQVQYLVLPDVWYSAMLSVLLVLLARRHMLGAALMMFPLMMSRESTSLTLLCFLIAAWGAMRWLDRMAAVGAAAVGSAVVGHLTRQSPANVEHLPQAIYILAKVPWNFLRNVAGVLPWSNVNGELCEVPRWTMHVPLGKLQAVGICGVAHGGQLDVVVAVLTQFGLLPMLVAFLWWRHRRVRGRSPLLQFALLYGAAAFMLAPLLGNWLTHLTGYGWPLFFVALPLLLDELAGWNWTPGQMLAGAGFFAVHLAVCANAYWPQWLPLIGTELVLWGVGFILLRRWWGPVPA